MEKKKKKEKLITLLLEEAAVQEAKATGLSYPHLFKLGILAAKNNPQLIQRVRTIEERVLTLEQDKKRLYARLTQLGLRIEEVKEEVDQSSS